MAIDGITTIEDDTDEHHSLWSFDPDRGCWKPAADESGNVYMNSASGSLFKPDVLCKEYDFDDELKALGVDFIWTEEMEYPGLKMEAMLRHILKMVKEREEEHNDTINTV
jgi:hypothetical protein